MPSQKPTVRAREHYGTKSLDLTVPADLCRRHNVQIGDVFEVSVIATDVDLKILYRRVYAQPKT